MAMDVESIRALQSSINAALDRYVTIAADKTPDKVALAKTQQEIFKVASDVISGVIPPGDQVLRLGINPIMNAAVQVSILLGLFNIVEDETSLETLAEKTGADPTLLFRVMRCLSAFNIFTQDRRGRYKPTMLSKKLKEPQARDWAKTGWEVMQAMSRGIPDAVSANGFKNPVDRDSNAAVKVWGLSLFEYLNAYPHIGAQFTSAMKQAGDLPLEMVPQFPYSDYIPDLSRKQQQWGSDAVTLVDLGGGSGQEIENARVNHPQLPGRFVLQELPPVISMLKSESEEQGTKFPFELMVQDFFMPQPLKNVKFFHIRHALHDWPDDQCVIILRHLRDACVPGYSRVLIAEFVLPDVQCGQREASMDILMMSFCGMERDESQWRDLLARAGLKIKRIVMSRVGCAGIIEAVRDDDDEED